jgi:hypothetical protein
MRHHDCTIRCVKAENLITELGTQLIALKAKLRKKNILIGNYEMEIAQLKKRYKYKCEMCKPDCLCPEHLYQSKLKTPNPS